MGLLQKQVESLICLLHVHLSDKNNAPHLAESEVLMRIGDDFKGMIFISEQSGPEFKIMIGEEKISSRINKEISDP